MTTANFRAADAAETDNPRRNRVLVSRANRLSALWTLLACRSQVLLCIAVAALPQAASGQASLDLERLFAMPAIAGTPPSAPVWAPDSRHFAFTWNDAGGAKRSLWLATADGESLRELVADDSHSVREIAWLPDGRSLLNLRGQQLWLTSLNGGQDRLLGSVGEGASNLSVSPDGRHAAFLQGGDLWLFGLDDERLRAATDVGIEGISALSIGRYNRPEREIGPGIWGGPTYAWSPDSRTIAVHYVDRRGMRKVPFPDYLAPETSANEVRRGYPGDPNESRQVGLVDIDSGEFRLLPLADPSANQVVGFAWSSRGALLLDIASDTAVDRRLYVVEPESDELNEVWHSRRPGRIYTSFAAAWHADGEHIIFLSDIDDRYGLYSISVTAKNGSPERITSPDYDVLAAPDVLDGSIFYSGNGVSPYEQHVYQVAPEGGTAKRLTTLAGQNRGYPSPDGRHLAVLHSNDVTPPDLYLVSTGGGSEKRITSSPPPEFHAVPWVQGRYVSFPSAIDEYRLHARILQPADIEPGKQYPVVFGPMYSNTVRNRWAGVYGLIQQLLVQKGYIVVQVDVRGSTGYGRAFREEFLVDFAGEDIEDIASAASYMKTLPHVDGERFGIWGSSYGGTLSVYTLLKKPGLFRAGVAAAAAVDPYFFGTDDVAIVRRPETNPGIFQRKAAALAANLEDHLLILHGMQDQVVPFKTTAALADVLIRSGKNFDFAFAPGATHAWSREPHYNRYLFGKLIDHFDRYLGPASE